MKKLLLYIPIILMIAITAGCGARKRNNKNLNERRNTPVGTTNVPDTGRRTPSVSPYPDPAPAPIPNPNPNPPSPNPPM